MTSVSKPSEIFQQAVTENSNLEMDWLWFAQRVESEAERRYCLEKALYINPKNRDTARRLARSSAPASQRVARPLRRVSRMLGL